MVQNIFKYANKYALRFPYKGQISVEDLFDLGITELDEIYKTLTKQQKSDAGESLIKKKTTEDKKLEVKIAIVKEIFEDKITAIEKSAKVSEKKAQAQRILEIMNHKEDEKLANMSMDELQAELDAITSDAEEDEE